VLAATYVEHFNGASWEPPRSSPLTTRERATVNPDRAPRTRPRHPRRVSPKGGTSPSCRQDPTGSPRRLESGKQTRMSFLLRASATIHRRASCNPQRTAGNEPQPPFGVFLTPKTPLAKARPDDRSRERWKGRASANVPGWTVSAFERSSTVAFTCRTGRRSQQRRRPRAAATNGKADVYEYEANGEWHVHEPEPAASLIPAGTSNPRTAFLDASASAATSSSTRGKARPPADHDTAVDISVRPSLHVGLALHRTPPAESRTPCNQTPRSLNANPRRPRAALPKSPTHHAARHREQSAKVEVLA